MKRVSKVFTLSVYNDGQHKIKGKRSIDDYKYGRSSFAESLSPLGFMIDRLNDHPLGTKIKVTMSVIKGEKK